MPEQPLEVVKEPSDSPADEAEPTVAATARRAITEDWAATILGLTLLLLILVGVISKGMIP